jgi:hypothetical protein
LLPRLLGKARGHTTHRFGVGREFAFVLGA